jgi:arsenate reductase
MQSHYNVLFLCTGNSARSIMAEAIMNRKGGRNFTAYSAGSHPSGFVRPEAIRQIETAHLPTTALRSKSWDEFSRPDSPPLNFVFTVCDNAANEVCPFWPGQPMTAHWGIPDPAAVNGTPEQIERAFRDAFASLDRRISLFLALPLQSLDTFALQREIDTVWPLGNWLTSTSAILRHSVVLGIRSRWPRTTGRRLWIPNRWRQLAENNLCLRT